MVVPIFRIVRIQQLQSEFKWSYGGIKLLNTEIKSFAEFSNQIEGVLKENNRLKHEIKVARLSLQEYSDTLSKVKNILLGYRSDIDGILKSEGLTDQVKCRKINRITKKAEELIEHWEGDWNDR